MANPSAWRNGKTISSPPERQLPGLYPASFHGSIDQKVGPFGVFAAIQPSRSGNLRADYGPTLTVRLSRK